MNSLHQLFSKLIILVAILWLSSARPVLKSSDSYNFWTFNPVVGESTDIYLLLEEMVESTTKLQITFPPANIDFVDGDGVDPISMVEENSVEAVLEYYDAVYTSTVESYTVDGSGYQEVIFLFENLPSNQLFLNFTIKNVVMPYTAHQQANALTIPVDFLDQSDVSQLSFDASLRSIFAAYFGSDTSFTVGEDSINFSLEIPMDLPSGISFRMIYFLGTDDSSLSVDYTCNDNCASSPTITHDDSDRSVLIEGIVDTDVTEGTVIDFTLSGFTIPELYTRYMFYYQITYGEGTVLEGQGEVGEYEGLIEKLEGWLVYCPPCDVIKEVDCDADDTVFFYAKKNQVVTYCELILLTDWHSEFTQNDWIELKLPGFFDMNKELTPFVWAEILDPNTDDLVDGYYELQYTFDLESNSVKIWDFKNMQYYQVEEYSDGSAIYTRNSIYIGFVNYPGFLERFFGQIFQRAKLTHYDQYDSELYKMKLPA